MSNVAKARWLRDKLDDVLERHGIADMDAPILDAMCVEVIRRLDEDAERYRAALQAIRAEITLGGGEFEQPDIDRIFDAANKALEG